MINVVFLLLIFFMVAGNIRVSDPMPVDAPDSAQDKPVTARQVLYIASDGTMVLGKDVATLVTLPASLKDWLLSEPPAQAAGSNNATKLPAIKDHLLSPEQPQLAVKADAQLSVAELRSIMSLIRKAGILKVELLTNRVVATETP